MVAAAMNAGLRDRSRAGFSANLEEIKVAMEETGEREHRYGWVVVGAAAILLAVGIGIMGNTITVFVRPLEAEFGWSRGAVSLI